MKQKTQVAILQLKLYFHCRMLIHQRRSLIHHDRKIERIEKNFKNLK